MAVVFIDPGAAPGGDGSAARPYAAWAQVTFRAGDVYAQRAGTVAVGGPTITAKGSEAAPIVLGAYGEGAAPVIRGTVNLDGAAYVTMVGLAVRGGDAAAVMIQRGAHHNAILGNAISDSAIGVWVGAGGDNVVAMNSIVGSARVGIAVAGVANPAGEATVIAGNTIRDSGAHGIDIHGSGFVVAGNTVSGSGHAVSGSSGIHVWGGFEGAPDGFGVGNIIVGNVTTASHDARAGDGNGIQLDQYTSGNLVLGNFASGNDGAGIVLFDAHDNAVIGNVAEGNQRDSGGTHPLRADILLAGSMDLTQGNYIAGNVGLAATGPAVVVDWATADNPNLFTGNVWQSGDGGVGTELGLDRSWAAWLGNPLTGGAGMAPDAPTGVPLTVGATGGGYAYAYPDGTVKAIDGTAYGLLGWNSGSLFVSGEAVM